MRVKRLEMQSFRGIGDLTLDFDEKEPTVFVGINGVGKSSILDCIAILLSQMIREIAYRHRKKSSFDIDINTLSSRSYRDNKTKKAIPGNPEIENIFFGEQDITNGHQHTNNKIEISLESKTLEIHLSKKKGSER